MATMNLPSVYNLIKLDKVNSTNTEAKIYAQKGEEIGPHGTLIWALQQTQGRGRLGKHWDSPLGNLYSSLILRPDISLKNAAQIGFVAALAIYDALGNIGPPGHQIHCKWPNDILLNGKKVAGILLESESQMDEKLLDWLILGVGINVEYHPNNTALASTSIRGEGWTNSVEETLQAFCRSFLSWSNRWIEDGFEEIRKNWLWRSIGKGEKLKVNINGKTETGIFHDLADDGALLLSKNSEVLRVTAGEVFFVKK